MSFEGQNIVVTGGTRGLGKAMSLAFLERGASVHATYRSNETAADALRDECARFDGRLHLHSFDVADYEACEAFWRELDDVEGGIQVLVNNSGIRRDALLALMSPAEWNGVIATNLTGGYNMSKFGVLNMLRQRYGRIIFITSPAGAYGIEGQCNYAASKAGQIGLMRSLAKEVAKRKITVNCVSPGFIATELLDDLPQDIMEAHRKSVPLKRFGTPEEVAAAVQFLASREASYVTGSTLEVTGGL
jgi:3-oxoacyl-[acyl-carrier protein] reductase